MAWEMLEFNSSSGHIDALAYDMDTQTLSARFSNGAVYEYVGVTGEQAEGFAQADSATDYLRTMISPMAPGTRVG
jgi:hypothetical protein